MTDYRAFYANQTEYDPTRTVTLRARWVADWNRRIKALQQAIAKVIKQDTFGFGDQPQQLSVQAELEVPQRKFQYRYSHEKVDGFMQWLKEMESRSLLEIVQRPGTLRPSGEPWSNLYVRSAYQKGLEYARANVNRRSAELARQADLDVFPPPAFRPTGGAISAIMQQPFHADRLALAYTRVFDELKGVTSAMDQQISRVLTRGLAEGLNPWEIGKQIAERVEAIGATRGRLIARTETINIHAQAALNEYYSVEKSTGEVVLVQWKATHDSRVRDTHLERDKRVYTKEEAYALIGEPNCRCALLPYIPATQGMPAKASAKARRACLEALKDLSDKGDKTIIRRRRATPEEVQEETSITYSGMDNFLEKSPIKNYHTLNGGVNDSFVVHLKDKFEGKVQTGIFKPISGERVENFDVGDFPLAAREVMAREIAVKLGIGDMVPETILRDIADKGKGSFQRWADDAEGVVSSKWRMIESETDVKDLVKANSFDYLINNSDRHSGNYLRRRLDGKIILIDNGSSFGSEASLEIESLLDPLERIRNITSRRSLGLSEYQKTKFYLRIQEEMSRMKEALADLDLDSLVKSEKLGGFSMDKWDVGELKSRRKELLNIMNTEEPDKLIDFLIRKARPW